MSTITIDGYKYYPVPSLQAWQTNYWVVIYDRFGGELYVREDKINKPTEEIKK